MMLNSTSKEGYIKLLFEVDGQHYLIVRNLKKGKVKESCNTMLYIVNNNNPIFFKQS
ncbi:hypothetical protein KKH82_05850 [Patescibacteria group bacterium]|nr:hypothetical protein [Patescibacteria group bacterium]